MAYLKPKLIQIVDLQCDWWTCKSHLDTFEYDYEPDADEPEFQTSETEYSFCNIDCLSEFITSTLTPDFVLNDIYEYPSNIEEKGVYIKVILKKIEQNSDNENK